MVVRPVWTDALTTTCSIPPRPEGCHFPGLCPANPPLPGLDTGNLDPDRLIPTLCNDMVSKSHNLVDEHLHVADLRLSLPAHDRFYDENRRFGRPWHPVDVAALAALHNHFGSLPENLVLTLLPTRRADDSNHSLAIESLS